MASKEVYQEKEDKVGKFLRWAGIFVTAGIVLGVVLHAVNLEIAAKA